MIYLSQYQELNLVQFTHSVNKLSVECLLGAGAVIGSGGAGDTVMIQAYVFLKLCSSGEKWTINFKTRNTSEEGDRLIVEVLSDKMTSVLERNLKRSGVGGGDKHRSKRQRP